MDGLCSTTPEASAVIGTPALQYPQRMDGLCSCDPTLAATPGERRLAVSSADGRALQPYYLDGSIVLAYSACSILSGWTGFAAPELSWQQTRSADPCSILSGWTGFAACAMRSCAAWKVALAVSSADGRALQPFGMYQSPPMWTRLQYPQRMDGLCSACDHPIRASQ